MLFLSSLEGALGTSFAQQFFGCCSVGLRVFRDVLLFRFNFTSAGTWPPKVRAPGGEDCRFGAALGGVRAFRVPLARGRELSAGAAASEDAADALTSLGNLFSPKKIQDRDPIGSTFYSVYN